MSVLIETTSGEYDPETGTTDTSANTGDLVVDLDTAAVKECTRFLELCENEDFNGVTLEMSGKVLSTLRGGSGISGGRDGGSSSEVGAVGFSESGDLLFSLGEKLDHALGHIVEGAELLEGLNGGSIEIIHVLEGLETGEEGEDAAEDSVIGDDGTKEDTGLQAGLNITKADSAKATHAAPSETTSQALTLEIIGDLPFAEIKPSETVLFVCKLNPVTEAEDLELIFSRFGEITGCQIVKDPVTGSSLQYGFIEYTTREDCERAYLKMEGVLIDDHRIHVDFSQSVRKMQQRKQGGGGREWRDYDPEERRSGRDSRSDRDSRHRRSDDKRSVDRGADRQSDRRSHRSDRDSRDSRSSRTNRSSRSDRDYRESRDNSDSHDSRRSHRDSRDSHRSGRDRDRDRSPGRSRRPDRDRRDRDRDYDRDRDRDERDSRDRRDRRDRREGHERESDRRSHRPLRSDKDRSERRSRH
jgi:peptidyl-prolyl cis-trans isomerase-like 4